MNIQIREATVQDAEAIAQLSAVCMGYDYPIADTAENLRHVLVSPCDTVFVAVAEGETVGYIHANEYRVLYAPFMVNIMGIAVAPSCRRCGIGGQLLSTAEHWAVKRGASAIRLVSGAQRAEAHAFYSSCGFDCGKDQKNFKKGLWVNHSK